METGTQTGVINSHHHPKAMPVKAVTTTPSGFIASARMMAQPRFFLIREQICSNCETVALGSRIHYSALLSILKHKLENL